MSYYFEDAGDTLWNPLLQVGKLFVAVADATAEAMEMSSGLAPAENDTCAVDTEVFGRFVKKLQGVYFSTGSRIHRELIRPLLLTCLVMLERSGVTISVGPAEEGMREQLDRVARTMAV